MPLLNIWIISEGLKVPTACRVGYIHLEKSNKFSGKRVLITGASRGLGYICAQYFEKWGAQLVVNGRTQEKLDTLQSGFSKPSQHLMIKADLLDDGEIDSMMNKVNDFMGGIDIVVHTLGGGYGFSDPLLSKKQFQILHALNLGVAAEINRLVVPEMQKRKSGNLIHVCSVASQEATGSVGYNTVKAALAAYVRSLGRELAESEVIATGILPGGFYAPDNVWKRHKVKTPERVQEFIENRLPRKKMGEASEIIPLIALLASRDASMMAGSCVPIDAGEGLAYLSV